MRKLFVFLITITLSINVLANDNWPAIGKYKLTSVEVDGEQAEPAVVFETNDVSQTYFADGKFIGQVGENSIERNYRYSASKKSITILDKPNNTVFKVAHVSSKKYALIIATPQGDLQLNYKKVK